MMFTQAQIQQTVFFMAAPYAFLTADILSCHGMKSTGVNNNINNGSSSVIIKCLSEPWQCHLFHFDEMRVILGQLGL